MSRASGGDLGGFEARLRQLEPVPEQLSRDKLLFEAGRRSAKAGQWRLATGVLGLACLGLAVSHAVQFLPAGRSGPTGELAARVTSSPTKPVAAAPSVTSLMPPLVLATGLPKSEYVREQERLMAKLLNGDLEPRAATLPVTSSRPLLPLPPVEVMTWATWAEKVQKRGF